jgi:hypothetical protein
MVEHLAKVVAIHPPAARRTSINMVLFGQIAHAMDKVLPARKLNDRAVNSPGCRRDFRVKMWGTSSPEDKFTGDLGNVIETTQIGGRRSDRLTAGKLSPGNFGLLQQYRHKADISKTPDLCPLSG